MLLNELKEIKSGRRERHQFALLMGVLALLLGAFLGWRSGFYPAVFIVAALFLLPVVFDKVTGKDTAVIFLPLQKVWMGIAVVLGTIVSSIVLAVFFFGIFSMIRGVNRVLGKTLLDTAWSPGARESYWILRDAKTYDRERTEKQF